MLYINYRHMFLQHMCICIGIIPFLRIVVYAKHEMIMSDMRQKCLLQPKMRRQTDNGLQIQTLIWPSPMNLLSLSSLNQNALPLLYLMHDNPQCIYKIYSIYNLVYINNLNIGNFCKVRGLKALNPQKQQKLSIFGNYDFNFLHLHRP